MKTALYVIGILAVGFSIYAMIAYVVSVLISYILAMDFGFWKAAALLLVLSLLAGFIRGATPTND
jgi:uncharacterized membrane protein